MLSRPEHGRPVPTLNACENGVGDGLTTGRIASSDGAYVCCFPLVALVVLRVAPDDAIVDGADGSPFGDGYKRDVGREIMHSRDSAVLVGRGKFCELAPYLACAVPRVEHP